MSDVNLLIDRYYNLIEHTFRRCENFYIYKTINYELVYNLINFLNIEFAKTLHENSDWINANVEIKESTHQNYEIDIAHLNYNSYNPDIYEYLADDIKPKIKCWNINVEIKGYLTGFNRIDNLFQICIDIDKQTIFINRIK